MSLPLDLSGCVLWLDAAQDETVPSIFDHFARADSSTTLNTSDSGDTWTAQNGTWGVSSGRAYLPTGSSAGIATLNGGTGDATVEVIASAVGGSGQGNGGLVFRFSSTSNYWRLLLDGTSGQIFLQKVVSGSASTVWNGSSFTAGDRLSVILSGSSIAAQKNGTTLTTATDSFNSTATNHGLWINNSAVWALDDFAIDIGGGSTVGNGDPLFQWTDRSGSGNDAHAGTCPIWRTNQRNGHSVVDFTQTSGQYMVLPGSLFDVQAGTTFVVAVARVFGDGSPGGFPGGYVIGAFETGASPVRRWYLATTETSGGGWNVQIGAGSAGVLADVVNRWNIVAARANGNNKRGAAKCGGDVTFTDSNTGSTVFADIGRLANANQEYFEGQVGEIIHWNRALTDSEFDQIVGYLKDKWDITCDQWHVGVGSGANWV